MSVYSQLVHAQDDKRFILAPVWSTPYPDGVNLGPPAMRWFGTAMPHLRSLVPTDVDSSSLAHGHLVGEDDDVTAFFDDYLHPRWQQVDTAHRHLGRKVSRYTKDSRRSVTGLFYNWSPGKDLSILWALQPPHLRQAIEDILTDCLIQALDFLTTTIPLARLTQTRVDSTFGVTFIRHSSRSNDVHLQINALLAARGHTTRGTWQLLCTTYFKSCQGILDRYIDLLAIPRLQHLLGEIVQSIPIRAGYRPGAPMISESMASEFSRRSSRRTKNTGKRQHLPDDTVSSIRSLSADFMATDTAKRVHDIDPAIFDGLRDVSARTAGNGGLVIPGDDLLRSHREPRHHCPAPQEVEVLGFDKCSTQIHSVLYSALAAASTAVPHTQWSSTDELNDYLHDCVVDIISRPNMDPKLTTLFHHTAWLNHQSCVRQETPGS